MTRPWLRCSGGQGAKRHRTADGGRDYFNIPRSASAATAMPGEGSCASPSSPRKAGKVVVAPEMSVRFAEQVSAEADGAAGSRLKQPR